MPRPRKNPTPENPPSPVDSSQPTTSIPTPHDDPASPTPTGTPEPFTPGPSSLKRKRGRPSRTPADHDRRTATPADDEPEISDAGTPSATPAYTASSRKRRGRPPTSTRSARNRGGPSHVTSVPLDKDGNPQIVEDDEIVLPEDPAGEQKVDKLGYLQGGREYRCRTFTILGRGERLYMLSTEPARCIGFRDSYLFFQKHKQLFKIIMDDDEKFDMIKRELIPHSYKGRAIGVVTARSVFREFGSRIIVGGRRVVDDYWEGRERAAGVIEGQLADPEDRVPKDGQGYNRNQYVAWFGASSVYHTGQPSVPMPVGRQEVRKKKVVVTDTNWMLEHARAASQFNSRLTALRKAILPGVHELHTNTHMRPAATQPSLMKWESIPGAGRLPTVETVMTTKPYSGRGLLGDGNEWDMGIVWRNEDIESLETEEERAAVREQVQREREWRGRWGYI
ncbi:chromatin structure-remodeling complex subunit RSC7 [Rhizina undulata]